MGVLRSQKAAAGVCRGGLSPGARGPPVAAFGGSVGAGLEAGVARPRRAWQAADPAPEGGTRDASGEAPGTNLSQSASGQACREGAGRHILENDTPRTPEED